MDESFWQLQVERMWHDMIGDYLFLLEKRSKITIAMNNPQIKIDYNDLDPWIRGHLEKYSFDMIKNITEITRRELRALFDEWLAGGYPYSWLIDKLKTEHYFDPVRAKRIAITESTRLYAENNMLVWRESKMVEGKRWHTANDEKVCPICQPLHEIVVALDDDFASGIPYPPAHVNCRCGIRPVMQLKNPEANTAAQPELTPLEQIVRRFSDVKVVEADWTDVVTGKHLNSEIWTEETRKKWKEGSTQELVEQALSGEFRGFSIKNISIINRLAVDFYGEDILRVGYVSSEIKHAIAWRIANKLKSWLGQDFYDQAVLFIGEWAHSSNTATLSILMQKLASKIFDSGWNYWQDKIYRMVTEDGKIREVLLSVPRNVVERFKRLFLHEYETWPSQWQHYVRRAFLLAGDEIKGPIPILEIDEVDNAIIKGSDIVAERLAKRVLNGEFGPLDKIPNTEPWLSNVEAYLNSMVRSLLDRSPYFLQAMYENTQEFFRHLKTYSKFKNFTHIALYRGISEQAFKYAGIPVPKEGTWVKYMFGNGLESWTTDLSTASMFGNIVFYGVFPVERVVGSAFTGFGCLGEQEFVLMSSPMDTVYVVKSPEKSLRKAKKNIEDLSPEYRPSIEQQVRMLPDGTFVYQGWVLDGDWIKKSGKSQKELQDWAKWEMEHGV